MKNNALTFGKGIKNGLPIGLGYFSVAFAFGIRASALGLPFYVSVLISMTNLTSAGQLAGVNIVATLGAVTEMLLTQAVINSRYFLMSVSLSQKFDSSFTTGKRFFLAAFVTDEIFAVAASKRQNINAKYFFGLAVLPYLGWTAGTLVGAVSANALPAELQSALNIALYAMFIAIVFPVAVKSLSVLFTAAVATGLSCLCYYLPFLKNNLSQGFAVVICALVAAALAAWIFPVKEDKETENERNS